MIIRRQPLKMDMDLIFGDKKCHIIKILGQGTSSIVYKAKLNNRTVVLKELYPRDLGIVRGIDNSLIVPKNSLEIFEQYTEKFIKSFELQTEFHNNEKITNYTSDIEDIYECNNTLYTIMGIMTGNSYDNINPKNIMSVLKVGKSLAIAISYYHERNYLHLDIKPENIFILSETDELVQLFDFDTISTKEDILQNKFSFSNNYASPEVRGSQNGNFELSDIDERADIFSIGVVIFEKIMGKLPNLSDHREGKTWNFSSNPYLKNTVPQLQDGITKIFQKTLARNKTDRYSSVTELIQDLDKLTELAAIKVFLKSQNISPCTAKNIYISRKNICETIWNRLNQYNILYLYAICGNGKSEIAREYAETYANSYKFIQSIFYSQNLKKTIANLDFAGLKYEDKIAHTDEDIDRLYSYKLDLLGNTDIYTSNTLLIIDNYDYDSNPESKEYKKNVEVWSDLKKLHIHIIFTTRINPTDKAHCFKLENMSKTELEQLFFKINPIQKDDPERIKLVDEIIKVSYNHTMAVKLIALQSKKYKKSLEEYLSVLKENGLNSHIQGRITNEKDDESVTMSAVYDHIKALFDFDDLSSKEKYIMVNACLLPLAGLDTVTFSNFIDLNNFAGSSSDCIDESIEDLVNSGWIIYIDNEETKISLHPLICDIVTNELKPELTEDKCKKFYISFLDLISEWGNGKVKHTSDYKSKESMVYFLFSKLYSFNKKSPIIEVLNYIQFHNNNYYIKNYALIEQRPIEQSQIEKKVHNHKKNPIEKRKSPIIKVRNNYNALVEQSPIIPVRNYNVLFEKKIPNYSIQKRILLYYFGIEKSYNPPNDVIDDKTDLKLIFHKIFHKSNIIIPSKNPIIDDMLDTLSKDYEFYHRFNLSSYIHEMELIYIKQDIILFNVVDKNIESLDLLNFFNITIIGDYAFKSCKNLKKITIPDCVRRIGSSAFCDCTSLTEVSISNGVTEIKKWAFSYRSSLIKVDIPNSVTKIEDYTFIGCSSLTKITIPKSVSKIGKRAFSGCSSLTEIIIPNSVTEIENNAFENCSSLTKIVIPNGVNKIKNETFSGCSSLTEIIIPNSVTEIENNAFENCSSLAGLIIPNSITYIGYSAFSGCSSLTEIIIPNGVTEINNGAFENCSSLAELIIPDSITCIGYSAFSGCSSLTEIIIPNSVTEIKNNAFENCCSITKMIFLNSKIDISESLIGYYKDENGLYRKNNLTIKGYKGSTAEKYANEHDFDFVAIDEN
ncbi:leucine-rich repeat protein [Methanobrevibacter sp.]|uniref:leucine-rich repeat protein n=1 Tax=Methanobrevibacter sp. TaxID=66852 RepID=UPI0038691DE0